MTTSQLKIIFAVLLVFIVIRLPGTSLPYYQDEWKNVNSAESIESASAFFGHAHPPLMQVWFTTGHNLFGEDYFRIFPLLFSAATLILLFVVVRRRFGNTAALWTSALFVMSFYSIWGSLMADVDGSVVPFLFLLSVYLYDKFNEATDSKSIKKWLAALILVCLVGFLIKLSFILVIGALFVDFLWSKRKVLTLRSFFRYCAGLFIFGLLYLIILYFVQLLYPVLFSIKFMLSHARDYTGDIGRNWIQIIVQGMKAIFYLSPLLLAPILFIKKEMFEKTRIFFIYLFFGFIFYFILFDFSAGVLDKYLMFMTAPLSIISGVIVAKILKSGDYTWQNLKWPTYIALLVAAILVAINFLPHNVMSLYPKTEWFSRVLSLRWNFLNPFNGGSGPIGFYVSFLFIAVSFIASFILGIVGLIKKEWRKACIIIILIIGLAYNAIFAEELMFGKLNGSAPDVLKSSITFIENSPSIKQVMSYNDIGHHEISKIGKWGGRFYAAPQFAKTHRQIFANFEGQYLVVDIARISEDIFYGKFLAECDILFETSSGKITGKVYDCSNSKKIIDSI